MLRPCSPQNCGKQRELSPCEVIVLEMAGFGDSGVFSREFPRVNWNLRCLASKSCENPRRLLRFDPVLKLRIFSTYALHMLSELRKVIELPQRMNTRA